VILGHEATGVVTKVGKNVRHVREGDLVLVTWVPRDAEHAAGLPVRAMLETSAGTAHSQNVFTWANYTLADEQYVVKVDASTRKDVTSIIGCAVMTGAGAIINTLQVRSGQSVAVFGAGGIGLCAISAAAIVGAHPVIAVDINQQKLDFARRFGATHVVNAQEVDPVEGIRKLTDGGVDFAIDAVGLPQTQEQILRAVRPGFSGRNKGGTALLIGITPPNAKAILDTGLFVGSRSFTRTSGGDCRPDRDFPTFIRWYREGKLKLDELITNRYKLEQINDAVDDLAHGRILGRGILTFS
jgi:Zn-dependent alcohol dehydrogenase